MFPCRFTTPGPLTGNISDLGGFPPTPAPFPPTPQIDDMVRVPVLKLIQVLVSRVFLIVSTSCTVNLSKNMLQHLKTLSTSLILFQVILPNHMSLCNLQNFIAWNPASLVVFCCISALRSLTCQRLWKSRHQKVPRQLFPATWTSLVPLGEKSIEVTCLKNWLRLKKCEWFFFLWLLWLWFICVHLDSVLTLIGFLSYFLL